MKTGSKARGGLQRELSRGAELPLGLLDGWGGAGVPMAKDATPTSQMAAVGRVERDGYDRSTRPLLQVWLWFGGLEIQGDDPLVSARWIPANSQVVVNKGSMPHLCSRSCTKWVMQEWGEKKRDE